MPVLMPAKVKLAKVCGGAMNYAPASIGGRHLQIFVNYFKLYVKPNCACCDGIVSYRVMQLFGKNALGNLCRGAYALHWHKLS